MSVSSKYEILAIADTAAENLKKKRTVKVDISTVGASQIGEMLAAFDAKGLSIRGYNWQKRFVTVGK